MPARIWEKGFTGRAIEVSTVQIVNNNASRASLLVVLASALAYECVAQTYPTRSIRGVVTAAPGGGNDFVARVLAQRLSESLGQPVVIDNRGGSGGLVGTTVVASAVPDGYTLLFCFVNFSIYPALYRKLPFDPTTGFAPISTLAATPLVVVVPSSLAAKSVAELITLARAKPDQLNFASTGVGSLGHLAGEPGIRAEVLQRLLRRRTNAAGASTNHGWEERAELSLTAIDRQADRLARPAPGDAR